MEFGWISFGKWWEWKSLENMGYEIQSRKSHFPNNKLNLNHHLFLVFIWWSYCSCKSFSLASIQSFVFKKFSQIPFHIFQQLLIIFREISYQVGVGQLIKPSKSGNWTTILNPPNQHQHYHHQLWETIHLLPLNFFILFIPNLKYVLFFGLTYHPSNMNSSPLMDSLTINWSFGNSLPPPSQFHLSQQLTATNPLPSSNISCCSFHVFFKIALNPHLYHLAFIK